MIEIKLNEYEQKTLNKLKVSLNTIIYDKYYKELYKAMIGNIPEIITNAIYLKQIPLNYVNNIKETNKKRIEYMQDIRSVENMVFNFLIHKVPEYILFHYLRIKGYNVLFEGGEGDMFSTNTGNYTINNNCDLCVLDDDIKYDLEVQYSYLYKDKEYRKDTYFKVKTDKLLNILYKGNENTYFMFLIYDFLDKRFKVLPINLEKDYDRFEKIGIQENGKKYHKIKYNIDELITL